MYGVFQPGLAFSPDGSMDDLARLMGISDILDISPGQITAKLQVLLGCLEGQYTLNLMPQFNIGLNGGLLFHLVEPRMLLSVGAGSQVGLAYRTPVWIDPDGDPTSIDGYHDYHPALDRSPVVYDFQTIGLAGGKLELRPKWFITSRIALSLRLGYLYQGVEKRGCGFSTLQKPVQLRSIAQAMRGIVKVVEKATGFFNNLLHPALPGRQRHRPGGRMGLPPLPPRRRPGHLGGLQ